MMVPTTRFSITSPLRLNLFLRRDTSVVSINHHSSAAIENEIRATISDAVPSNIGLNEKRVYRPTNANIIVALENVSRNVEIKSLK